MKKFPKILYVTRTDPEENEYVDYFVNDNTEFLEDEDQNTEVAVYQLVKTGRVVKSSKISFDVPPWRD